MPETRSPSNPPRWQVIAAFAAVYLIWGSTYLGIRFAIETIPPYLMAGTRFLIAGALLYGWMRLRGVPHPNRLHWRSALIIGGLLLLGGNGSVTWAEQRVPSGLASLLIATVPLWISLLDWLRPGGTRPAGRVMIGLVMGFIGMVVLVGPTDLAGGSHIDPIGALALIGAALSWSVGSLYSRSRHAQQPDSPLMGTAIEMLAGGGLLMVVALVRGEWGQFDPSAVSLRSGLALGYLILFGAIVGFSCYIWLLKVTTPARASTYAYVNPIVAVFLGWALASEPLSLRTLIAAPMIILAVVLITSYQPQEAVKAAPKTIEANSSAEEACLKPTAR